MGITIARPIYQAFVLDKKANLTPSKTSSENYSTPRPAMYLVSRLLSLIITDIKEILYEDTALQLRPSFKAIEATRKSPSSTKAWREEPGSEVEISMKKGIIRGRTMLTPNLDFHSTALAIISGKEKGSIFLPQSSAFELREWQIAYVNIKVTQQRCAKNVSAIRFSIRER